MQQHHQWTWIYVDLRKILLPEKAQNVGYTLVFSNDYNLVRTGTSWVQVKNHNPNQMSYLLAWRNVAHYTSCLLKVWFL